jgi:quercetin dioxygenase-like cupin family protein
MKVFSLKDVNAQVSDSPLFIGGQVSRQLILPEGMSKSFTVAQVNFSPGARNQFHTHKADQLLIVTEGQGICATETEERVVTVGDVIYFPAGEKHWHGATKDSSFSHIYVTGAGGTTEKA